MTKRCGWIIAVITFAIAASAWAGSRWDHRLMVLVPRSGMRFMELEDGSGVLLLESGDKLKGERQ